MWCGMEAFIPVGSVAITLPRVPESDRRSMTARKSLSVVSWSAADTSRYGDASLGRAGASRGDRGRWCTCRYRWCAPV